MHKNYTIVPKLVPKSYRLVRFWYDRYDLGFKNRTKIVPKKQTMRCRKQRSMFKRCRSRPRGHGHGHDRAVTVYRSIYGSDGKQSMPSRSSPPPVGAFKKCYDIGFYNVCGT